MTIYEFKCPKCQRSVGVVETNTRVACPHCGNTFLAETPQMNDTTRVFWCGQCNCQAADHEIALTGRHEECGSFVELRTYGG